MWVVGVCVVCDCGDDYCVVGYFVWFFFLLVGDVVCGEI